MTFCSLVLWGLFGVFLLLLTPTDNGGWAPVIVSGSLWGALVVTGTSLGILVRRLHAREAVELRIIKRSFRQAIWLASLCVAALWLSHFGMLTLLASILLIALSALFELWFLSMRR
ncbi:MAG: hypothetical protein AAB570_02420 [Patescibacteria group bacterium]